MMWKRRSAGVGVVQQLPEERKALAERYTIDADEAQRREQLAAEASALEAEAAQEEARRAAEAEEQARRDAQAELERKAAEEQARRAAEEEARRVAEAQARARRSPEAELEDEAVTVGVSRPDPAELASAPIGSPETENDSGGRETSVLEGDESAANPELPIYRWFGGTSRSAASSSDT